MKADTPRRIYIGLLHDPVYNKNGRRITSAVTTFDLHDLARSACTYGVKGFFVVTPLEDQQALVQRVIRHWEEGYGAQYNPDRKEALKLIRLSASLAEAILAVREAEAEAPLVIATDAARWPDRRLTYPAAAQMIRTGKTVLLLFGTAWGLDREVIERADYVLDPVEGLSGYNHLSVRAAAAIILDRVCS